MGRKPALWSVIVAVTFWSIYLSLGFFKADWMAATLLIAGGGILVAMSIQAMKGFDLTGDRRMYRIWCLWIGACCGLPVLVRPR